MPLFSFWLFDWGLLKSPRGHPQVLLIQLLMTWKLPSSKTAGESGPFLKSFT